MKPILELIRRIGPSDANVLLTGENGTGKGLVAQVIHDVSSRNAEALITVNIGVINLVPIPLLDGGRLVFLGYEKVRGKAPNRRVQEVLMLASVAFLVVVLLWVTKNDIVRIIHQLKRGLL